MIDDRVEGGVLVIRGAPALEPGVRRVGEMVFQHLHQARFANARLPAERDDVPLAVLDLGPAGTQQGDFRLPPDQGRQASRSRNVKATLHPTLPQDLMDVEGRVHAFERLGTQRLAGKIPLHEMPGGLH